MSVCVNDEDFYVPPNGLLQTRPQAARMVNNANTRTVQITNPAENQTDFTIPAFDVVDYDLGDLIDVVQVSGRFVVQQHAIYNVSAGYRDNTFATNDGMKLYLTILVDGVPRIANSSTKTGGDQSIINVSGDLEIAAGGVVQLQYSVRGAGRAEHFLFPSDLNFFAIHRVGRFTA